MTSWGNLTKNTLNHRLTVVQNADHNAEEVYSSMEGTSALFDDTQNVQLGWRPQGWKNVTSVNQSTNGTSVRKSQRQRRLGVVEAHCSGGVGSDDVGGRGQFDTALDGARRGSCVCIAVPSAQGTGCPACPLLLAQTVIGYGLLTSFARRRVTMHDPHADQVDERRTGCACGPISMRRRVIVKLQSSFAPSSPSRSRPVRTRQVAPCSRALSPRSLPNHRSHPLPATSRCRLSYCARSDRRPSIKTTSWSRPTPTPTPGPSSRTARASATTAPSTIFPSSSV